MKHLLVTCLTAMIFSLAPIVTFGSVTDLSPSVLNLSREFSEKFCISIKNGVIPEKASESAAAQLSKGLLFSPVMNEIMSATKEDLAENLSNDIFDECGKNIGGTQEELDNYVAQLVKKIPSKSSNSFQLAPIRQQSFN